MDPYNNTDYQWPDQMESHEMNERAPINYNQNTYMTSGNVRETSVESLNIDSMQVKGNGQQIVGGVRRQYHDEIPKEGGYVMFWKYAEQLKGISAGLLLLLCCGMHTVWAIYQVLFYETSDIYKKDLEHINTTKWREHFFKIVMFSERNGLMFTIVMWFVGVMLGCYVAGWFLVRVVQKRNIYYIAALMMFASGCIFYSADVVDSGWQALLLCGRLFAGISHGITYVTILVQASENAAKDFRRIVVTTIGVTIGLSTFIASTFLIYIPIPTVLSMENSETSETIVESNASVNVTMETIFKGNVVESSEMLSAGVMSTVSVFLAFVSVIFNYFFTQETVPFLLYHNYREEEAQFTLSKLLGEDRNSPVVQQEFDAIRELCHDDYAEYPEGKIFSTIHRGLMSIPLCARITSAQCLNMLWIIFFVKYIQYLLGKDLEKLERNDDSTNDTELYDNLKELLELAEADAIAVRSLIATWFVAGLQFTLIGNYFNWKRGFHFTTFVVGASLLLHTVFHLIGFLSTISKAFSLLFVSIYVHFLLLPIDILGLSYLTECFPISTKAKSIAFVTICECIFNSMFISFELRHEHPTFLYFFIGILFTIVGYKLYSTVPNTLGLSLAAAKHAYVQVVVGKKWWQI